MKDSKKYAKALAKCPTARRDEHILVEDMTDEYVVYDLQRHKIHALNPTAAMIWQWCDGQTSPDALAQRLSDQLDLPSDKAEALVQLGLDRLESAHLLTDKVARLLGENVSVQRRQVLRLVGIASLLPVVASIFAPSAYAQVSTPCGPGCTCANAACANNEIACCNVNGNVCTCSSQQGCGTGPLVVADGPC